MPNFIFGVVMPPRMRLVAGALALVVGCGGNYSNEDLEFQAALPARSALEAHPPSKLVIADSAEYYRVTRDVIATLNGMVVSVMAFVDLVRGVPASSRSPGARTWGPFPVKEHPGWQMRVRMVKSEPPEAALGLQLDYAFEIQRSGAPASEIWLPLLIGNQRPGGPARASGEFHIATADARAAGYPIDDPADPSDLNEILTLDVRFEREQGAIHTLVDVQNVPGAETADAHYQYDQLPDGAGSLSFTWHRADVAVQELTIISRWLDTGAGRADGKITAGFAAAVGLRSVDCWRPDTRASYVQRDWDAAQNNGDATSCVLGPPPAF